MSNHIATLNVARRQLVWEVGTADHRLIASEQWSRIAELLHKEGLTFGVPRRSDDVIEVEITETVNGASSSGEAGTIVRVVQTEQRRRELENRGSQNAVVVLQMLPLETAGLAVSADRKQGPLSFGCVASEDKPLAFTTVIQAFMTAFGIDDDVRLTLFGVSSKVVEMARQCYLMEAGPQLWSGAAPPEIRSRPISDLFDDCCIDVAVSVDTGPGLQPLLLAAINQRIALIVPRVGGQTEYLEDGGARFVECRSGMSQGAKGIEISVVPDSLQKQMLGAAADGGLPSIPTKPQSTVHPGMDAASIATRLTALARLDYKEVLPPELTAWVSTWNSKCGIAGYLKIQLASVDSSRHLVLAPRTDDVLGIDGDNVARCWDLSKVSNHFDDALNEIDRLGVSSVVIHFNWGFFNQGELSGFIESLVERRVVVFVELHSTKDPPSGERLADLAPALRSCDRVLVHGQPDVDRLLRICVQDNIVLQPHGVLPGPMNVSPGPTRLAKPLVATFGYSFPNKGLVEFVRSISLLKQRGIQVRALMLNAAHPIPASAKTMEKIEYAIELLDLRDDIEFRSDFLEDAECLRLLAGADLIVNPYQTTNESASGAVRYGLAARRPVLVTPLDIFDDLGDAVFRANGVSVEALADGIALALHDLEAQSPSALAVAEAASNWLRAHDVAPQAPHLARLATSIRLNRAISVTDWPTARHL